MFSKTFVVVALVAGALAAPSSWEYVFLYKCFFFCDIDMYPTSAVALVNAAPPINSAVTKSRALTTPNLLGFLQALVSPLTPTSLLVSPATPSPLLALLATNGK